MLATVYTNQGKGGATVLKVGVQLRERSERKNWPPPFAYLEGIKQTITARFIIVIMTSKRLPAPNEIT